MNILVIDAQGGGIGRQVITAVRKAFPQQHITAVGTNSAAVSATLKAGADVLWAYDPQLTFSLTCIVMPTCLC